MLTPHIIDNGLVIFNKVTNYYDITKKNPEFMLNIFHLLTFKRINHHNPNYRESDIELSSTGIYLELNQYLM
jgi:hypothetical protein